MAQETHFTPGPWTAVDNSWEYTTVYSPDDIVVAEIPIGAEVNEDNQDALEAVKEANAHLISAAPEMYEALGAVFANHAYFAPAGNKNCRFCDNDLDHEGTFRDMHAPDCVGHIIRAARAKARGE